MRKTALGTFLKKLVLVVVLIAVVLVGFIFLVDQYRKTDVQQGNNKYPDKYWEELNGFVHYSEWEKPTFKYNLLKAEYESPFKAGFTVDEILEAARYDEELEKVTAQYRVDRTNLETDIKEELNKGYKGSIYQYVLLLADINPATSKAAFEEFVDLGYLGTEEDFIQALTVPTNIANAATHLTDNGIDLVTYYYEVVEALLKDAALTEGSLHSQAVENGYEGSAHQWALEAVGVVETTPASAFEKLAEFGYTGTKEDFVAALTNINDLSNALFTLEMEGLKIEVLDFISIILNDTNTEEDPSVYAIISDYDKDKVAQLEQQLAELINIINKIDSKLLALPNWEEYFRDTLLGGYQKVLENDRFELWFQVYNTFFKLVDKKTGNEWYSNPNNGSATEKTVLNVYFSKLGGLNGSFNSYADSVADHDVDTPTDKLTPNYATFFDPKNNVIQVWYKLQDRNVDISSLPQRISYERFQELLKRNKQIAATGAIDSTGAKIVDITTDKDARDKIYTTLVGALYGLYKVDDPQNTFGFEYYEMTAYSSGVGYTTLKNLYRWFYEWFGYTEEDLLIDNNMFGVVVDTTKPAIEIAIEYCLTESGLQINIPGNSIVDTEETPITTVDLLPYFTATDVNTEGYTIIPDGSGALLNHNNGNYMYPSYSKRVYTTDLTTIPEVKATEAKDIMFPMFSVVNTNIKSGLIFECEQGAGQLKLNADISGRSGSLYNTQSFSLYLREMKYVYIGPSYARKELPKWTTNRVEEDFIFNVVVLEEDELNYSAVAKRYRDILVDRYNLEENDTTDHTVLDLDVIGSYDFQNNFAGIPYTDKGTLTTFEQLDVMLDTYLKLGVRDINVFYLGWRDSGLLNKSFKNFKISPKLGTKTELLNLMDKYERNVDIYPYLSFGLINKYEESFGHLHYTTRSVDGKYVISYPYDLNSNLFNKKASPMYAISPAYYQVFMNQLVKNYNKKLGIQNISLDYLGSKLSGDYKKDDEVFKEQAIAEQVTVLQKAYDSGLTNMNLYTPYPYAFRFADNAKEIPYETTKYEILDSSIPFYQLVVSGLFDYSGEVINANSEKGLQEHIMRIMETGSNIAFSCTYDSSSELLNTDYNTYFYTTYTEWLSDVEKVYSVIDNSGISRCELVEHEVLGENIYRVTYKNNIETIVIILNYTRVSVNVDGYIIEPKNYKIIG